MLVRDLFKCIADRFPDAAQRRPYYNVVRSVIHRHGNVSIEEVSEEELTTGEARLFDDIKTMAGVNTPAVPATESVCVQIGHRIFTVDVPGRFEDEVVLQFEGVKVTVSRAGM